jgi:tape measure domain-containing protein
MAKDLNVSLGLLTENFKKGLKSARRELRSFARRTEEVGSTLTRSLSIPLGGAAIAAIKSAADFEKLEKQLTSVTGSADASAEQIARLKEIAKSPGLGFEQAVSAAARLQAVGLNAQQAESAIAEFGNAVARSGGGAVEFDGAILALTQIASKGKISAEEINQLNERIFEIRPVLERAFGTSSGEELQKLGISSEEFIAKVTEEFSKLDRVQGGLSNSFENLQISVRSFLADIGKVITTNVPVQRTVDQLSESLNTLSVQFQRLSPAAQSSIIRFSGIAVAIGPVLLGLSNIARITQRTLIPTLTFLTGIGARLAKGFILLRGAVLNIPATFTAIRNGTLTLGGAFGTLAPRLTAAAKAFRAFNLATKLSIIGAVVLGITALALAVQKFKANIERASAVNRIFSNVNEEAEKSIVRQKTAVDRLVTAARDDNKSKQERISALNKLQQIAPKYFNNLSLEKSSLDQLTTAQENFNKALLRQAKIKAAEDQLVDIQKQLLSTQQLVEESKPGFFQTAANAALSLGNGAAFAGRQIKSQTKNITANISALKRQEQALLDFLNTNQQAGDINTDDVTAATPTVTANVSSIGVDAVSEIAATAEQRLNVFRAALVLATDTQNLKTEQLKTNLQDLAVVSENSTSLAAAGFKRVSDQQKESIEKTTDLQRAQKLYNKALLTSQIIADKLGGTFDAVFTAIDQGKNAFKAFRDGLKQVVLDLIKAAAKAAIFAAITSIIFPGAGSFSGVFKSLFSGFTGIPIGKAASGGIVTRSQILNVGEEGAEAIIPLDRINEIGGMGGEVRFTIEGTDLVGVLKNNEDTYNRIF